VIKLKARLYHEGWSSAEAVVPVVLVGVVDVVAAAAVVAGFMRLETEPVDASPHMIFYTQPP
jgi:hypothetical protein